MLTYVRYDVTYGMVVTWNCSPPPPSSAPFFARGGVEPASCEVFLAGWSLCALVGGTAWLCTSSMKELQRRRVGAFTR